MLKPWIPLLILLLSGLCWGMVHSDCGIDLEKFRNWTEIYGNNTTLSSTVISSNILMDVSSITITDGLVIDSNGWLLIHWNSNGVNLNADTIIVKGKFQIGSSVCPLLDHVTINLQSTEHSFNFDGTSIGSQSIYVASHGSLEFWGASPSSTFLAASVQRGETQISLADPIASSWTAGDQIVIVSNDRTESCTISDVINSRTVLLSTPLSYAYRSLSDSTDPTQVHLLSRPIVIYGGNSQNTFQIKLDKGYHLTLRGVELRNWHSVEKQVPSISCSALDECHFAGIFDSVIGECSNPLAPNGTACNDNNTCTLYDVCEDGVCVGYDPVICEALECQEAYCDPDTGQCIVSTKPDGTDCSDEDECTLGDICIQGTCTPQSAVLCAATDQCHDVGVCDRWTGMCSLYVKPNGTACSFNGDICSNTDTCEDGVCTGVVCPEDTCKVNGECIPANSTMCWEFCAPDVTTAIVSSTITTNPPFAITFATFTTHGTTLTNGTLYSAPYEGGFELIANSSTDETRGNTTTQYWTFRYSPLNTCVLDGEYVFSFDMNGWPEISPRLSLSFTSHDFCAKFANASAVVTVQLFEDDTYYVPANRFTIGSTVYVAATVLSPIPVEGVELIAVSVNGYDYMSGIGQPVQLQNGVEFSLPVVTDPFQVDQNYLLFEFKINYSLPLNMKQTVGYGQNGTLSFAVNTEIVEPAPTPLPSNGRIGALQHSAKMSLASSPELLYAVAAVAGFLMLVLGLAIGFLSRKIKKEEAETKNKVEDEWEEEGSQV